MTPKEAARIRKLKATSVPTAAMKEFEEKRRRLEKQVLEDDRKRREAEAKESKEKKLEKPTEERTEQEAEDRKRGCSESRGKG